MKLKKFILVRIHITNANSKNRQVTLILKVILAYISEIETLDSGPCVSLLLMLVIFKHQDLSFPLM